MPLSLFGSPSELAIALAMIDRANNAPDCGANGASTFAGVPQGSFVDGCNPVWGEYFHFDLDAPTAPNAYAPSP